MRTSRTTPSTRARSALAIPSRPTTSWRCSPAPASRRCSRPCAFATRHSLAASPSSSSARSRWRAQAESFEMASDGFRFGAAVAEFAEILRHSQHVDKADLSAVREVAQNASRRGDEAPHRVARPDRSRVRHVAQVSSRLSHRRTRRHSSIAGRGGATRQRSPLPLICHLLYHSNYIAIFGGALLLPCDRISSPSRQRYVCTSCARWRAHLIGAPSPQHRALTPLGD